MVSGLDLKDPSLDVSCQSLKIDTVTDIVDIQEI